MKNSMTFEEQTEQIVEELLSDFIGKKLKPRAQCQYRSLAGTSSAGQLHLQAYVPPGAGASDTFDPVIIAGRLQAIGDKYNEDLKQPAQNLIAEITAGKQEKFRETVESISKNFIQQNPELAFEKACLVVSVKLCTYLAGKVASVNTLLTEFFNGNLRDYIEEQGGWFVLVLECSDDIIAELVPNGKRIATEVFSRQSTSWGLNDPLCS